MFCDDCRSNGIELTRRTSEDITIVVGECRICHKTLVEKWRKVRAYALNFKTKDQEAIILVAEKGTDNANKVIGKDNDQS